MKTASLLSNLNYNEDKPAISVLLETEYTKEIRIAFKEGQQMKEHQTPFPIVVEIFEGFIEFGVNGQKHQLEKGSVVALEGAVPHDLLALKDSIVRLTLSKSDSVKRVQKVIS